MAELLDLPSLYWKEGHRPLVDWHRSERKVTNYDSSFVTLTIALCFPTRYEPYIFYHCRPLRHMYGVFGAKWSVFGDIHAYPLKKKIAEFCTRRLARLLLALTIIQIPSPAPTHLMILVMSPVATVLPPWLSSKSAVTYTSVHYSLPL